MSARAGDVDRKPTWSYRPRATPPSSVSSFSLFSPFSPLYTPLYTSALSLSSFLLSLLSTPFLSFTSFLLWGVIPSSFPFFPSVLHYCWNVTNIYSLEQYSKILPCFLLVCKNVQRHCATNILHILITN